ncbi:MAG: hypothetical protein U1E43_00955 [Rhodospirillales bacterium]
MDAAISRFICTLKRCGVGISPAEAMDAVRALAWAGLADRETVRSVLRSTLIKRLADGPLFDEQFDLFFAPFRPPAEAGEEEQVPAAAPPAAEKIVLDTEDEDIPLGGGAAVPRDRLKIQPGDLAELARNMILKRAESLFDPVMQRATHRVNARHVGTGSRPGQLNFAEIMDTLGADLGSGAIDRLLDELRDGGGRSAARPAGGAGASHRPGVAGDAEAVPRAELARRAGQQAEAAPQRRPAGAGAFTENERREMAEIVRHASAGACAARSYRRGGLPPRPHPRRPHPARQHGLRRHPVPPGDDQPAPR